MGNKVYVLGSVNYDLLISTNRMPQNGETIAGYDYFEAIGGKGGNQAATCATLGASAVLIGSVGSDYRGELAIEKLKLMDVDVSKIHRSYFEPTGCAFVIRERNENRIIISQGANADINKNWLRDDLVGSKSDIFLTQFEVPLNNVYEGLEQAKKLEMITVVNPAPAVVMNESFYKYIDYLIMNQSEAEILSGIYPENIEMCRHSYVILKQKGVQHCIFTLGSKGCIYIDGELEIYEPGYKVDVVDTTGAGDTFIGAFVFALSRKFDHQQAILLANAAGAMACEHKGAQAGIPTYDKLQKFITGHNNDLQDEKVLE